MLLPLALEGPAMLLLEGPAMLLLDGPAWSSRGGALGAEDKLPRLLPAEVRCKTRCTEGGGAANTGLQGSQRLRAAC